MSGPLRIHPDNPRYFTDDTGKALLLTGSHTWNNLVDMAPTDPPTPFDAKEHFDWLASLNHNFIRLWTWELLTWDTNGNKEKNAAVHHVWPLPWKRTGPDTALDGKPKFDLQQYEEAYFRRLRTRLLLAQERGIYVAVMLFEGWGLQHSPNAWENHPFHPQNNVEGLDGDLNGDGKGLEVHSGRDQKITERQRAYVRKVIDTVNEFDCVLYEISNENHPASTDWQYAMIRFIKEYEQTKPKQHSVGMTYQHKGGNNQTLFDSPADWISPNGPKGEPYRDNPPVADGSKVILADTDHFWGIGGNDVWVWKSFLRGLNPIFMDPHQGEVLSNKFDLKWIEPIRKNMGHALDWSRRVDLAAMKPQGELASSHYCLANRGKEYLVYAPPKSTNVSLKMPAARYSAIWFDTATGKESEPHLLEHTGDERSFEVPSQKGALLYVRSLEE